MSSATKRSPSRGGHTRTLVTNHSTAYRIIGRGLLSDLERERRAKGTADVDPQAAEGEEPLARLPEATGHALGPLLVLRLDDLRFMVVIGLLRPASGEVRRLQGHAGILRRALGGLGR